MFTFPNLYATGLHLPVVGVIMCGFWSLDCEGMVCILFLGQSFEAAGMAFLYSLYEQQWQWGSGARRATSCKGLGYLNHCLSKGRGGELTTQELPPQNVLVQYQLFCFDWAIIYLGLFVISVKETPIHTLRILYR